MLVKSFAEGWGIDVYEYIFQLDHSLVQLFKLNSMNYLLQYESSYLLSQFNI